MSSSPGSNRISSEKIKFPIPPAAHSEEYFRKEHDLFLQSHTGPITSFAITNEKDLVENKSFSMKRWEVINYLMNLIQTADWGDVSDVHAD